MRSDNPDLLDCGSCHETGQHGTRTDSWQEQRERGEDRYLIVITLSAFSTTARQSLMTSSAP